MRNLGISAVSDPKFEEVGAPASEEDIGVFERRIGGRLPDDYRAFLKAVNGGRPVPSGLLLTLDGRRIHWGVHFLFGLNDAMKCNDLLWNYLNTRETCEQDVVPIASDESGGGFYLSIADDRYGRVFFARAPSNVEILKLVTVSDSFSAFLKHLVPDEMLAEFD